MYKLITILTIFFIVACSPNRNSKKISIIKSDSITVRSEKTISDTDKNYEIENTLKKTLDFSRDINGFENLINSLDRESLISIAISKEYIEKRLDKSIQISDSLYYAYLKFFYETVNHFNATLYEQNLTLITKINNGEVDSKTTEFHNLLEKCDLELFSSEGYYYVDSKADFFYNLFTSRLSIPLIEYIRIRRIELKEGFSHDAFMIISFEQLSNRVKKWEDYITNYPDAYNIKEAKYYYQTYLETFLTGMDNSRVFEMGGGGLNAQIKALYQSYVKENPNRISAKIVEDYYKFIKRHGFKYNDSINLFLKKYNLSSMLGVQPHSR